MDQLPAANSTISALTNPRQPHLRWIRAKARDLLHNPYVSLAYVAEVATPLYVECLAHWADTHAEKRQLWDLFAGADPPLGYDPAPIFGSVDGPDFGALKLTPWRIQLFDAKGTRRTWLR